MLVAARETGAVVTLEEHSIVGGLGGAVAEILCEAAIDGVVFKRLGLPSAFCKTIGDQEYLLTANDLSEDAISTALLRVLDSKLSRGDILVVEAFRRQL